MEKRAREVHGRSSARGPSDRTLIPFKGEARRRYAAAHRVGGKEGREREKERKREEGRSRLDRASARPREEDRRRTGMCGGETARGEGEGLKEVHCLPSEADNSVMNVSNARSRSGL